MSWGRGPHAVIPLLLVGALTLAACQRARPTAPGSSAAVSQPLRISEPTAGQAVGSPLTVVGEVRLEPSQALVGMVYSQEPGGSPRWRGNARIAVSEDGRFSGSIAYTADQAAPGFVELAVLDSAAGTTLISRRVEVQLGAAPAPAP